MARERQCVACDKKMVEHFATLEKPYHFLNSGLPNVYLVGIKYYTCESKHESAEIPAIESLMALIARDVAEKRTALTGDEIRFLRKRLGQKSSVFAKAISVKPESLSRIENGHVPAGDRVDKLVRYHYAIQSEDPILISKLKLTIQSLIAARNPAPSEIVAAVSEDNQWDNAVAA